MVDVGGYGAKTGAKAVGAAGKFVGGKAAAGAKAGWRGIVFVGGKTKRAPGRLRRMWPWGRDGG